MASYSKVTKAGVVWSLLARGMNEIVSIPATMILARMLTPQDFGIAAAAGFFVQIANRLTNFGFNTALVQIKDLTPLHTGTIFVVNIALGVGVWALLALTSPLLGRLFDSQEAAHVIPVATLSFAIGSFGGVPAALLNRELRYREVAWLDWLYTWVNVISVLSFAFAGFGYWSLIYSQVLAAAVQAAARFYLAGWLPSLKFSRSVLRELLSFGIGLHFKRLLDSVALNVDTLVVGWGLGLSALGFYDKAFTLMNRAANALNSAGPAVSFRVFALIQEEQERFRRAYRRVLLTATFLAYPLFTALGFAAPELFVVMFGRQWDLAIVPFQILCLVGCLRVPNAYASTAIQSRGWIWGEVWRQVFYVLLIGLGVVIGSRWGGLIGASVGVLMATVIMTVLMQALLNRAARFSWSDVVSPQVPALVCSAGLALCMSCLELTLRTMGPEPLPPLVSLGIKGVAAALYGLAFVRIMWFVELRSVITETVEEFAPRLARVVMPAG